MELTIQLSMIHDVIYVSQLKKCVQVPEKIIKDPDLEIESDLTYEEKPIKILDQKTRDTRTKRPFKVQWNYHTEEEATWEQAEYLEAKYPELFEEV